MNTEKEQTAIWRWPDTYSDLRVITVTNKDLQYIQNIIVGWDVAELGAPGLMSKEGDWLFDEFEDTPRLKQLLSLFFNQAKLKSNILSFSNSLLENVSQDVVEEALYGLKDASTKKILLEQKEITLEIDTVLKELWNNCDLRPSGFDPKRGFKLENLQALIDPDKKLSKSQLAKEKQTYKGKLFLCLQGFLQQAKLELGDYHSYDGDIWIKGKDYQIVEERTAYEWWINFNSDYYSANESFVELMKTLPNLCKHLCANGAKTYQDIAKIFNFNKLYQYDHNNINRVDVDLIEIILKAVDNFSEEDNQDGFSFVQLAIRIYNAQGKFKEAQNLLQEYSLDFFTEDSEVFFSKKPNKFMQVAFYESCICKMGLSEDYTLWLFPSYPKIELLENGLDIRKYLDYKYRNNFDLIYEDFEQLNQRDNLDDIIVSVIGQINFMHTLEVYNE